MTDRLAAVFAVGVAALTGEARAQAPVATTQVYEQAYFAGASLSTAEDMLRRVPGAAAVLDASAAPPSAGQARGLGAGAEQILIDGKRLASKSTTASATLRRIPATSVERIELIRGGTDEVQSEGLVINVVLKTGLAVRGVGNFEASFRFTDKGERDYDGLVSYADSWRGVAYVIGYERNAWAPLGLVPNAGAADWTTRTRSERYFYPSGALQEDRPQAWRRVHQKDTLSFTATAPLPGGEDDSLRLSLLYQTNPVKVVDTTALTRFSQGGVPGSRAVEDHYNKTRKDSLELGAELEKAIGPGALNAIALASRAQVDFLDFRNRTETSGVLAQLGRSVNDQQTGEDVLRVTYALPLSRAQTVTVGAEGAANFLHQEIGVFFDLDRDGRLEAVPIPTARAEVAEKRGELSLQHSWKISPRWTLDSYLAWEISRIETNYPAIPIRTLNYGKPRLDLRFNPNARDRFRFKAERTIGQLDFANFVPAYNVVDNRIDLGNPLILPSRTWLFETGYERRLAGDNGALGSRLIYRQITGAPNFVPFGVNSAGLPISARGNNNTAIIWGWESTAALRLRWLPGAQVNGRLLLQDTGVTDSFTKRRRQASQPYASEISLSFRQDLNALKMSYGVDYLDTSGNQLVSDVRNAEAAARGARVNLFVERALNARYSLRLDAYNINGAEETRRRILYTVSQTHGAVARFESYTEKRDRRFALRLRGKF